MFVIQFNKFTFLKVLLVSCFSICLCDAIPKLSQAEGTYSDNPWRRAYTDNNKNLTESASNDRTQRLGYSTGYGSSGINGYPYSGTGVGSYSPLKIDLGGVVIGTLVGIGALLILPKLVNVFSGGYGHYRSVGGNDDLTGVQDMLSKVDDFLAQNNIDSSSCMQKAVCNYIRSSDYHISTGTADQIEHLMLSLSENSLVDYMLGGTAIKEAIDNGKNQNGRECDSIYQTCPLDRQSTMQLLKKFLPNGGQ